MAFNTTEIEDFLRAQNESCDDLLRQTLSSMSAAELLHALRVLKKNRPTQYKPLLHSLMQFDQSIPERSH